jgi:hypothetical protein
MEADGTFVGASGRVGSPAQLGAAASAEPGLDQLAGTVTTVVGQGLRVMIQIVPTAAAGRAGDEALATGLRRLATRFRDVAGLVGFEIAAPTGASAALNGAVRDTDAHHLLWRQGPAAFDPTVTVVTNDDATLLVGWATGDPATVLRLLSAADAAQTGWFFDRPVSDPTLDTLIRPYPSAVAGIPVSFTYLPAGRLLALSYVPAPAAGGTFSGRVTTQIRVPARVYPDGYLVQVQGATVVSAPGAGVVCLVTEAGAARVDVRVEPAPAGREPAVAPPAAGDPCPEPRIQPATPAAPGQAAGSVNGTGTADTADPAARQGDGGANGVLLWVLPLLGATGMASVLAGLRRRIRRGRGGRAAAPGDQLFP